VLNPYRIRVGSTRQEGDAFQPQVVIGVNTPLLSRCIEFIAIALPELAAVEVSKG
jgi:hypothetical protein